MKDDEFLPRVVARHAAATPDRIALRDRERIVTYGQLDAQSAQVAAQLYALGLGRGDRLLLLLPNGIDVILIWLASCRLGAIFVPLNTAHRGAVLKHQSGLVDARIAIVSEEARPQLLETGVPFATILSGESYNRLFEPTPTMSDADLAPSDPMAIFFTSGTTGPSKGVLYSHGQAHATAQPMAEQLTADDVFYWFNPMFHVALPHMVGATLLAGGTVALREKYSVTAFWQDVRDFGATATMLLGATAGFVASRPTNDADQQHSLRKVFMVPLLKDTPGFEARFGVRVMSWFNMTEVSTPIHTHGFGRGVDPSCGRLRHGAAGMIVDGDGRPVADGEAGELLVRTIDANEMNLGYFRNPDATAEAWRGGWFHTGDVFRRDAEGNHFMIDRARDAIRRRGENISSYEVESEICTHPDVVEAAVVATPSEVGEDEVIAHVVRRPGTALTPQALAEFLGPRMAAFMQPRYFTLHDIELRKTSTGKVQKQILRDAGLVSSWDRLGADHRQ